VYPNELVRYFCSQLAKTYPDKQNYVEAIVIGCKDVKQALQSLLNSPNHRKFLLGENEFWQLQNSIGVGYLEINNNYFYTIHIAQIGE
jgi:uncharacterized protein YkwD